jgi:hypothetical protein
MIAARIMRRTVKKNMMFFKICKVKSNVNVAGR